MVMNEDYPAAKPKVLAERTAQGREAPSLIIEYLCPECDVIKNLNAYDGPPSCLGTSDTKHSPTWMTAMSFV